tara:strand:+ start:285 stop:848 length:564 start_codon:yes stop_codon:yes gene_type:complete
LNNSRFFRLYDLTLSIATIVLFSPLFIIIFIICCLDTGKPIFIQKRVGKNKKTFNLIKFRTMKKNTPSMASHMISKNSITKLGSILRLLKFDELPQLINVLRGEMSLVGPRPCLINQRELINLREKYNLFSVRPGITGLSQINGIDMSNPKQLSETDYLMVTQINQINYFKYLFLTFFGKGIGDRVV